MGQSKICERQPLKNFTWSILEYFIPYKSLNKIRFSGISSENEAIANDET